MKKIVLIGDSIRMGYDKYVKEALQGAAEVYYPSENCRYTLHILRFVHEWKAKGEWGDDVDLVHWNVGAWDCLELFGDEPLTPIDCYARLVARIDKRLRMLFPKAKFVFATCTTVLEDKMSADFKRHNAVLDAYNQAAIAALKDTDTIFNDLYSVVKDLPESYHSDPVHYYTDAATELIGGKVLSVICKELDIAAAEVNIENFEPERYSKQNIGF
ncbi:MAG: SGNH/GDSL hydrolase family protein [Clostridia bacterium]|nr:SGNH/GDSL hydrolase family protein [Clostridiales bacterium]MBQ3506232.1 SGNH/GDSL hydrolase family protein [Clostridia bacterium]